MVDSYVPLLIGELSTVFLVYSWYHCYIVSHWNQSRHLNHRRMVASMGQGQLNNVYSQSVVPTHNFLENIRRRHGTVYGLILRSCAMMTGVGRSSNVVTHQ